MTGLGALRAGEYTDPGPLRSENQDRTACFETPLGRIVAVADGMGGHRDGGWAAETVLSGLEASLGQEAADGDPVVALRRAAQRISKELTRDGNQEGRRSPGATLALALVSERGLTVAHAGDSRVYRLRRGRLERLTRDHSLVGELLSAGALTEEQARNHPESHVLLRAFSPNQSTELEISTLLLEPGDRLILCSDGLCGALEDPDIQRLAGSENDPQIASERLVHAALEAGSEDNVTVQLICIDEVPTSAEAQLAPRGRYAVLLVAAVLALGVGWWAGSEMRRDALSVEPERAELARPAAAPVPIEDDEARDRRRGDLRNGEAEPEIVRRSLELLRAGDPAAAEAPLRDLLKMQERRGDVRGQAETKWLLGIVHGRRSELDEGLRSLEAAAALYRQADRPLGHFTVLMSQGEMYSLHNRPREQEAVYRAALRELEEVESRVAARDFSRLDGLRNVGLGLGISPDRLRHSLSIVPTGWLIGQIEALVRCHLAEALMARAALQEAAEALEEADVLSRPVAMFGSYIDKVWGDLELQRGNLEKAGARLERAARQSRQFEAFLAPFVPQHILRDALPELQSQRSQALLSLGQVEARRLRFERAEQRYVEAREAARASNRPLVEGWALLALADLNGAWRRFEERDHWLEATLTLARKHEFPSLEGRARILSAFDQVSIGRYDAALREIASVIDFAEDRAQPWVALEALWIRAVVYGLLDAQEKAESTLGEILRRVREHPSPWVEASARMGRVWIWLRPPGDRDPQSMRDRLDLALLECRASAKIAESIDFPVLRALAANCEAGVLFVQGRFEDALVHSERAARLVQEIREPRLLAGIASLHGTVLLKLERFPEALEVFESSESLLGTWVPDLMFSAMQFGRGAAAARLGGNVRAKEFLEQAVEDLEGQYDQLGEERVGFGSLYLAGLRSSLVTLSVQTEQFGEAFRHAEKARARELRRGRGDKSIFDGEDGSKANADLPEDATLVSYFLTSSNVYAWIANRGEQFMATLSIHPEELRRKIEELKQRLSKGAQDDVEPLLAELHAAVWEPLAPQIEGRRIFLVPHGPLHDLPFAALPGTKPGSYLAEEKILIRVPFAKAALGVPRRVLDPSARLLALAGNNLPNAVPEVREIAKLYGVTSYLGPEASESLVRRRIPDTDLLHVAAHGRIRSDRPQLGFIDLAPGEGHDGQWMLEEIRELDLSELDLVVLSVCESSAGEPNGGDEIQSLARAFLEGRSGGVVTAAWSIQDEASRVFMEAFYRHLRRGVEAAEALSQAQRDLLDNKQNARWRHPYYWAGFQFHDAG